MDLPWNAPVPLLSYEETEEETELEEEEHDEPSTSQNEHTLSPIDAGEATLNFTVADEVKD